MTKCIIWPEMSHAARRVARVLLIYVLMPSASLAGVQLLAQNTAPPPPPQPESQSQAQLQSQNGSDQQVGEAIEKKLQASSQFNSLHLGVWVQNGIVSLSGAVPNSDERQQVIAFVRAVPGVESVKDYLTVGMAGAEMNQQNAAPGQQNSGDQSQQNSGDQSQQNPGPPDQYQGQSPENQNQGQYPENQNPENQGPPPPNSGGPNGYGPPPGGSQAGPPPQLGYAGDSQPPLETIPAGMPIHVMMLRGITSRHTKPGTRFHAVVVEDVILLNGALALPRGAYVEGSVIDARPPGHLKGHPKLALQLDVVRVGDNHYPLTSQVWARRGPGKGDQTTGNVVGGAAGGAIIGGAVGGGPTALLGALLGGLGGAGLSSLSHGARLAVPAESILTFYLNAPVTVREPTVDEVRSLAGNVPVRNYGPGPGYGRGPGPYYPGGYPPPPPPGPPGGYPY